MLYQPDTTDIPPPQSPAADCATTSRAAYQPPPAVDSHAGRILLGHDWRGDLCWIPLNNTLRLAVWGVQGAAYVTALAAAVLKQGWGVTFVGQASDARRLNPYRLGELEAAKHTNRSLQQLAAGWLVELGGRAVIDPNASLLTTLIGVLTQQANAQKAADEPIKHLLVVTAGVHPHLRLPLQGLLQQPAMPVLVSHNAFSYRGGDYIPAEVIRLVFGGKVQLAVEAGQYGMAGQERSDLTSLRPGWAYLYQPGGQQRAINTAIVKRWERLTYWAATVDSTIVKELDNAQGGNSSTPPKGENARCNARLTVC